MGRETVYLLEGWRFYDGDMEGGQLFHCQDDSWDKVSIPHDWEVQRPCVPDTHLGYTQGYHDRWGVGFYRYNLQLEKKDVQCHYQLIFDGVFENSAVWLNEKLIGSKRYGYSGFSFDVTDIISEGDNLLAVRVDNSGDIADRWYSGAGIYRKVTLLKTNTLHLNEHDIVTRMAFSGDDAFLSVDTGFSGHEVHAELSWRDEVVAKESGESILELFVSGVKRWSAKEPQLYRLSLSLYVKGQRVDELQMHIGFREIAFIPDRGMFVNGDPVKLKGVCLHHDAGCVGTAVTKNLWRQRLRELKAIGCNSIRTSHNIPSPEFMDLCDELGFYVIEESFDKWTSGAYGRFFTEDWKEDISFMVRRDRNRPSVIIWSVGNEVENQGHTSMIHILDMLVKQVKALDPARQITCGLHPHYGDDSGAGYTTVEGIIAPLTKIAQSVDIVSVNYQEQWYEKMHEAFPDKLILASESYSFFHNAYDNINSLLVKNPWLTSNSFDYVLGGFLWAGVDYLGESMGYPSRGWCGCPIRSNLEQRPIAKLFASYWSEEPMVHITTVDYTLQDEYIREQWSFPPMLDCWNYPMYRKMPIPYMIFTNCEDVRLTVNGNIVNTNAADPNTGIISGYLILEQGILKAEGLVNDEVVCRHQLITSEEPYKLEFTKQELGVSKDDGLSRQVLISVYAKDKHGVHCRRESGVVRFSIEGNGVIEGVDNGSMTCDVGFDGDRIPMLYGVASAVVRVKCGGGRITVQANSDGLLGDTVVIHAL